jgi:hypothetical protein
MKFSFAIARNIDHKKKYYYGFQSYGANKVVRGNLEGLFNS